jgi:hypothetical protein
MNLILYHCEQAVVVRFTNMTMRICLTERGTNPVQDNVSNVNILYQHYVAVLRTIGRDIMDVGDFCILC